MRAHEPPRSPKRWPFAVVIAMVGLWAFQLVHDHDAGAPRPQAVAPLVARPIAVAPLPRNTSPVAPTERAATVAITLPPRIDAGQVEVCGIGRLPLAADDPYGLPQLPPAVHRRALDDLEAQLLASADPQVRAAALLVGARARGVSGRSRIDTLARLAVVSQDPVVYAIALEGCKAASDAATCALLSRAQWVRLDPENAEPWLELAAQARQQHDAESEAEAMRRAARAHRSDAHAGLLPHLIDDALGAQVPPLQRTLAVSASWSTQASWSPSHTSQAYAYCMVDLDAGTARRDTCEALAETLASRGTATAELGVGIAIGQRLGWPAQRLQPLQQEHDAIAEAGGAPLLGAEVSCEAMERLRAWIRQVGTLGERQAMRERVVASGRSLEDWSAQYQRSFSLATVTAQAASLAPADAPP